MACLFLVVNEHELSPCFEFFGNMISFEKTLQDIKGIMYASPTNIHVPEIFQHY